MISALVAQIPPFGNGPVDFPDLVDAWSTPYLKVFDTLRAGIAVLTLYLIYLGAFSIALSRNPMQRAITGSYLMALILSTWTQIERIGRPLSFRIIPAVLMVGLGLYGLVRYLSGGHRLRHLTWRAWFIPPPPHTPPPPDMSQRLRSGATRR